LFKASLQMNPKVEEYIDKARRWHFELKALQNILLDCMLIEEFKWRNPCYTFQNANVIIIGGLKEYCILSFIKGALLKDNHGILINPGENSRSVRMVKFTNTQEIIDLTPILKEYIFEAIELEKEGLKVDFKKDPELSIPEEFQNKLNENPDLKTAFYALTPGRKRGYILYFSGAKQSKSRQSRIEKYVQKILDGKGINDCTCGLSRKMPGCDGSHKYL